MTTGPDSIKEGAVLLVGWDGAPHELVADLLDAGELPNLASLVDDGYFGPLETVPYVMSSCAWSTFLTGMNAGKHGVYDFYANSFREGSYFREPIDSTDRDGRDLGLLLNERDRTIGQLNVPMTFPAPPVDEFAITGMITPGIDSAGFVHPSGFLDDYESLRDYRIDVGEGKDADRETFLDALDATVESRLDMACYCLEQSQDLDVFFVVFTCPDRLSHYFFHFLDEDHPFRANESTADLERYRDVLPDLYRDLDGRLGTLIEAFREEHGEGLVGVVSDHGMRSLGHVFHVNKWLAQEGYLTFKPEFDDPGSISKKLDNRVEYIFGKVDWSETVAYAMGKRGAIYVNLEGREPEGCVSSEEYDEVVAAVKKDIARVVDPRTGDEVVEAVRTREDLFHGPHIDRAPDLLLRLSEGYYPFGYAFELDKPNLFSSNDWPDMPFVTGIEDGDGILALSGPRIADHPDRVGVGLVDMAPFLLHYLGQPVPENMDGEVPVGLLDAGDPDDVQYAPAGEPPQTDPDPPRETDDRVKDRLEDLGYL